MQTQEMIKLLDEVLRGLSTTSKSIDGGSSATNSHTAALPVTMDAIDRELAAAPRQAEIVRVRASETMERFRTELESQSLTLTTVTSLLQLVRQGLAMFGMVKA